MTEGVGARENISIAFHKSAYATPYGDNTVPGNHPGYRHKRLGRQYAPDPITHDSLRTDLHVPYDGIRLAPIISASDLNNAQNLLLPRNVHNTNYVLDTVRGGRRHFVEERGSEKPYIRMRRALNSPKLGQAVFAPSCRGAGVYNYDRGGSEVYDMFRNRERQKMLQVAGKAMVERRADHHPLYLGFMCGPSNVCATTEEEKPADVGELPAISLKVENPTQPPSGASPPCALHPIPMGHTHVVFPRHRQTYLSTRRDWSPVSLIKNDSKPHIRKRQMMESEMSRLEDVRLVELLPKFKTKDKRK